MEELIENKERKITFFNVVKEYEKNNYKNGKDIINIVLMDLFNDKIKNNDFMIVKKEWFNVIDKMDISVNLRTIFKSAIPVSLKKINEDSKIFRVLYLKVKNTNYKYKMLANPAVIEQIRKDINTRINKVMVEKIEFKI